MVIWLQGFPWKDVYSPDVSPWFALLCIVLIVVGLFAALVVAALRSERKK
jgi:hypothetical protein